MTDPSSPERELAGARLAIVSIYYWPEDVGIAPYTTAVAEHYAGLGAHVTAIVGMPHYPAWQLDPADRFRLRRRERRNGVDIRRFRTFMPRQQDALRRAAYEGTFLVNGALPGRLDNLDAVIAVIPNLTGGVIAAQLAARHRCPLGLIVQDLTGPAAAQSGMKGGGRVAQLTQRLEAAVLRRADQVAIVSEGFRPYLLEHGVPDERISELRNWSRMSPPYCDPVAMRAELGWKDDETIVLHAGNMGLKQGLEHVVAAARLAQQSHPSVRFVLMGDGNQRPELERQAAGLPNVTFLAPRDDYANVLGAADILLVNERSSVVDMSLPSKLTSYFMAGRPVLAAVAPGGTTAREVERSGGGVVVAAESPAALTAGVQRLTHDSAAAEALATSGQRYADGVLSAAAGLGAAEDWLIRVLRRSPSRARSGVAP